MAKTTNKAARAAAEADGLLDLRVRELPVSRWPGWARARYARDQPRSGSDQVAEPLTVDEA